MRTCVADDSAYLLTGFHDLSGRFSGRDHDGLLLDLFLEFVDRGLELGVLAAEGGVWRVVHDHVGLDAAAFDEPGSLGAINADLGGAGDPFVGEVVAEAEPDLTAPGSCADDLAEAEALEAFAEGLAVGAGVLIAEHDHVATERVLHVPRRLADAALPEEPGLSHEAQSTHESILPPPLWRTSTIKPLRLKTG